MDVSSAEQYPLEIPDNASITSLGNSLSPDKKLMVLSRNFKNDPFQKDLLIFDIISGTILHEIHIGSAYQINVKEMFSRLPGNVQQELSERNLGNWVLNESFAGSLGIFRWSADSRSLYFSNYCEGGYSCLYSFDLKTDKVSQLEKEDFFLVGIYPSPDNSRILLIKSPVPQLPDFPIFKVFVIDPACDIMQIPPMSSAVNLNYEYAWWDANNLVITGFNLEEFIYSEIYQYCLTRKKAELVSADAFYDYSIRENQLITIQFDQIKQTSTVSIKSDQQKDHLLSIPGECIELISSPNPGYIVFVSCDQGLFGIDPGFELNLISDLSGNFVFSPDLHFSIQYSPSDPSVSNNSIKLLDLNFDLLRELPVPDVRQIIWQPDSLGFLYMSMHGLFRVELPNGRT